MDADTRRKMGRVGLPPPMELGEASLTVVRGRTVMQQSVSVIVNRKRIEYQTSPYMRKRYRKIGFRMPAVAYRVTYKLHPYGNLIFIAYPNQPVQLPDTGNYRPSIIVN
ncbi:hypothetical protein LCGC14_2953920, partial [marine sediment metagenome]